MKGDYAAIDHVSQIQSQDEDLFNFYLALSRKHRGHILDIPDLLSDIPPTKPLLYCASKILSLWSLIQSEDVETLREHVQSYQLLIERTIITEHSLALRILILNIVLAKTILGEWQSIQSILETVRLAAPSSSREEQIDEKLRVLSVLVAYKGGNEMELTNSSVLEDAISFVNGGNPTGKTVFWRGIIENIISVLESVQGPRFAEAWNHIGVLYARQQNWASSLKAFRTAIRMGASPIPIFNAGIVAFHLDSRLSHSLFELLLNQFSPPSPSTIYLSHTHKNIYKLMAARSLFQRSMWEEAQPLYDDLLKDPPIAQSNIDLERSFVLLNLGKRHRALRGAERVIQGNPTNAQAGLIKSDALLQLNRPKAALASLNELISKIAMITDPLARRCIYHNKAVILGSMGMVSKAIELFRFLMIGYNNDPFIVETALSYSQSLLASEQASEACKVWMEFRQIDMHRPPEYLKVFVSQDEGTQLPEGVFAGTVMENQCKEYDRFIAGLWLKIR